MSPHVKAATLQPLSPVPEPTSPLRASRLHLAKLLSVVRSAARRFMPTRRSIRLKRRDEQASAMQFAALGRLLCVCPPRNAERSAATPAALLRRDHREVCRSCGLEVAVASPAQTDRVLTSAEIVNVVRSLHNAGVRASKLEIPNHITTLRELNLYLSDSSPKTPKVFAEEAFMPIPTANTDSYQVN